MIQIFAIDLSKKSTQRHASFPSKSLHFALIMLNKEQNCKKATNIDTQDLESS